MAGLVTRLSGSRPRRTPHLSRHARACPGIHVFAGDQEDVDGRPSPMTMGGLPCLSTSSFSTGEDVDSRLSPGMTPVGWAEHSTQGGPEKPMRIPLDTHHNLLAAPRSDG